MSKVIDKTNTDKDKDNMTDVKDKETKEIKETEEPQETKEIKETEEPKDAKTAEDDQPVDDKPVKHKPRVFRRTLKLWLRAGCIAVWSLTLRLLCLWVSFAVTSVLAQELTRVATANIYKTSMRVTQQLASKPDGDFPAPSVFLNFNTTFVYTAAGAITGVLLTLGTYVLYRFLFTHMQSLIRMLLWLREEPEMATVDKRSSILATMIWGASEQTAAKMAKRKAEAEAADEDR